MKRDIWLSDFFRKIISFLENDNIVVNYREEEAFFTKKSLMPSSVCRIKEVSSPSGKKLVITEEEIFPEDATISTHQLLYELSNNWIEPKRISAFMYIGEDGRPIFSDEELYRKLREIWGLIL
ncbi:MAG: hypothetical protein ACPLSJ_03480 [Thermosulfidibacteraceae bacterium]|jgi:hypothetical protein